MTSSAPSLAERNALAQAGGGPERQRRQGAAGKLTARQRLDVLCDAGSFVEIDRLKTHRCHDFGMADKRIYGDGVVVGHGLCEGRRIFVYAQDFTVFGGSLSAAHSEKICKVMDLAMSTGAPIVGLCDSGGARIQEGVMSLAGYADIFLRNTLASGVVPQISCIMGPCAGGAVYSPAITDFIMMVQDTSYMFITGPDVIKTVTHEEVSKEDLGGARAHHVQSGVAHFVAADDAACLQQVRTLLGFLPANNASDPPAQPPHDDPMRAVPQLEKLVLQDAHKPYDVKAVIDATVDADSFFEVQAAHAQNIVVGFARLGGAPIGVVANQPNVLAGCLDIAASVKAARFVRFCDCFNIPLCTFVDVPGFLPGTAQEHGGIIRHGAKLLYAYAEATVPKLTVILRKAYGGAYDVMASKHIRADINLAFPQAQIAVMGPEGAVPLVFKDEIARSTDPVAKQATLVAQYRDTFATPYQAAELGYVDEVIEPRLLRQRLHQSLRMLANKRQTNPPRKHGNLPL